MFFVGRRYGLFLRFWFKHRRTPLLASFLSMGIRVKRPASSMTQLDSCTRNRVIGMHLAGAGPAQVIKKIRKPDKVVLQPRNVRKVIQKFKENPSWDGSREKGTGPTPILTDADKEDIGKIVIKHRGKKVVTIGFVKRLRKSLRGVSDRTISRALHEAGLAWLRRRRERALTRGHKVPRISFSHWLKTLPLKETKAYAFVDGTAYYLALSESQAEDQERGRLGQFVWRDAAGKDGLFTDCVGPSLYAAKQGKPVKVWGFLCRGHLCIEVLPEDPSTKSGTAHMNAGRYQAMINKYGKKWLRECHDGTLPRSTTLIQDHERCLWTKDSVACLAANNLHVLQNYPVNSPDLNPIECVWAHLRTELHRGAPTGIESRSAFIKRLRAAVRKLNTTGKGTLQSLCGSMHKRADAVIYWKGARTGL